MPQHFKVVSVLKDRQELLELEEYARKPGLTVDDCWDWFQRKGYKVARSSVGRWLHQFVRSLPPPIAADECAKRRMALICRVISLPERQLPLLESFFAKTGLHNRHSDRLWFEMQQVITLLGASK